MYIRRYATDIRGFLTDIRIYFIGLAVKYRGDIFLLPEK